MAFDLKALRERACRLRLDALALALAVRHPRTPWYAKLLVAGLVAYVLTPVDLVPDAFPVLGLVDDAIFIPVALGLARRFVPAPVFGDCRARAEELFSGGRARRLTRLSIALAWSAVVILSVVVALHAV
ncbi:MAG TPA: DUF1232 domain-containing protein [Burkholderiales bacterium]|nr:DUF1232 domain-containing protein [Burkholderiales bacterium]